MKDPDWSCPWPREAEDQEIERQEVIIHVVVGADGRVETVSAVGDPGFGFAQAAMECAKETTFVPARDRDGRPTRSAPTAVRVRFRR
jgi:protein TonB